MRLIDANAIPWMIVGVGEIPVITKEEIEEMPTVDAVEVVRCKDCKYFVKGRDWFSCQKWYMDIRKDDYCSYGERKQK